MAGLIGLGQAYKQQAEQSLDTVVGLETRRNEEQRMAEAAKVQGAASGAVSGALIGSQVAPGIGTAVGAAIGLLSSRLF